MQTIILDSSIWVSYMLSDDINHSKAKKIVLNSFKFSVLIPDIVFYEVITVLMKLNRPNLAREFCLIFFKKSTLITLTIQNFLFYAFKFRESINLKTQDLLIIIFCLVYDVNTFKTFDKKQQQFYSLIKNYE